MLTGSKEQNDLSLFQGQTGIVMMRRTNRYQDVLYYGFKFIVLGKSRISSVLPLKGLFFSKQGSRNLYCLTDLVLV